MMTYDMIITPWEIPKEIRNANLQTAFSMQTLSSWKSNGMRTC